MTTTFASPITFKHSGLTAPNRFLKSAMTERLCTYDDANHDERGKPTPEYEHLYKVWGEGEIGVIVLGNLPIDRTQVEAKRNAIIDKRSPWDAAEAFKTTIANAKAHGSLVIGQLTNGGRQTSKDVNPEPYSSSDVQCPPMGGMEFNKPRPLTVEEIDGLVEAWAYGAEVLHKAGAHGAQLHSAHGYLLSQFLSARVNKRTDDYGGSLENRARIILRIVDEIKKRVPKEFLLSIKINSADFSEGGLTPEESRTVAQWLDAKGLDLIELSGGTYEQTGFEHKKESTKAREAYFTEFSQAMKPLIKDAKICVTGGFRSADAMNRALQEGATDLIGLGRPLTGEPYLCRDLIAGKITKARENRVNPALQTGSSVYEIGCIAHSKPIPDLSDEKVAEEITVIVLGKKPAEEKPIKDQDTSTYAGQEDVKA